MPGIGDSTARSVIGSMAERAWDPDAFAQFVPPPRAQEAHAALAALLRDLQTPRREERGVGEDIAVVRKLYDRILVERYDRPEPRLADLDQLAAIAAGYPGRAAFLAALALEPPQSTRDIAATRSSADEEGDALILSTAHSAKGKEWDAVFLIWAADGWFPSSRSLGDDEQLEEERRLMYVAMTRARKHLAVVYPLNAYATRWGADYSIDQLSRFIDRGVQAHMQRVVVGDENLPTREEAPRPIGLDLRGLLRGRFGGSSPAL
jgi:DNA helicase-2/ATP-dependent DNA helicase PcrA